MTPGMTNLLGQVLLHSLWQGVAVFVGVAVGLRLLRHAAPDRRFRLLTIGLVVLLAAPVATVVVVRVVPLEMSAPLLTTDGELLTRPSAGGPGTAALSAPEPRPALLQWIVVLWLLGVAAGVARLAGGWLVVRGVIRDALPVEAELRRRARAIAARLGVTRVVRYLVSADVRVPFTTGLLRPVVVLPLMMLSGLTAAQVDAILTHELAHIRRYDYLVSLLQRAVETLLFFHPVTWWLSRRISVEREYCCDDVAAGTNAVLYARALLDLETLRGTAPALGIAATGSGGLQDRIERILRRDRRETHDTPFAMLAVLVMTLVISGVAGRRAEAVAQPGKSGEGYVIGWRIAARQQEGNVVISSTDGSSDRTGGSQVSGVVGGPSDGVAILVGLARGSGRAVSVRLRSMNATIVPDNRPFEWLGTLSDAESIGRIQALLGRGGTSKVRSELGAALTLHDDSERMLIAVREVLTREPDEEVRAETAAWLGGAAENPEVDRLLLLAVDDPSFRVRDEALSAIVGRGNSATVRDLTRSSRWEDVRLEANQHLYGRRR